MPDLKSSFERILSEYPAAKSGLPFQHPIASFITRDFPHLLQAKAGLSSQYKVTGSVGRGRWATVPWVCVFDAAITESAQWGYYIVYLFNAEMKGVYLSLNQGWTQFEKFAEDPNKEIEEMADDLRRKIDTSAYPDQSIVLSKVRKKLARGYELGQICGKFYPREAIPSEQELVNDLQQMLRLYGNLKSKIGISFILNRLEKTFRLKEDVSDQSYQHEILESPAEELPPGPIAPPKKARGTVVNRYVRNGGVAKKCLTDSQYRCVVDRSHVTFLSHATKQPYAEAHHLVPVYCQGEYKKASLDVYENILVLCPLCHRKFHHAELSERKPLLNRFYQERLPGLRDRGIELPFDRLVDYYFASRLGVSAEDLEDEEVS